MNRSLLELNAVLDLPLASRRPGDGSVVDQQVVNFRDQLARLGESLHGIEAALRAQDAPEGEKPRPSSV